jgi:hypothetical protein
MECEEIDRSALAVDVERHFGRALPAVRVQPAHEPVHDLGVPAVEEPVEVLATPVDATHESRREWCEQALERRNREAIGATLLDSGHQTARHSSLSGQVLLPPSTPEPKRSNAAAKTNDIHRRSMTRPAYLPVVA